MTPTIATSNGANGLLVAVIGVVLVAPLLWRLVRRRFDPFEPIVLFAVAYGVMFVVRPTAMIVTDSFTYAGPREALDVSHSFTEMLSLALTGAIAFVVGYVLPLGGRWAGVYRRQPRPRNLRIQRLVAATIVVALVGLGSLGLFLASSGGVAAVKGFFRAGNTALPEGGASDYARYAFLAVVPATLILLGVALERRSKALLIAALFLGVAFFTYSIPTGGRGALLPLLGGCLVLAYLRRGARPSFVTILVVGIVAMLASTFLSDLRGRTTRGETIADTAVRATSPSRLATSLTTGPDTEMAPVLSAALLVIPEELGHTYGTTILGDLVARPVPRGLWEGKPIPPRHRLIATIWPIEYERGSINVEFSTLLYFYWDFSIPGIFLGLAAYGLLARFLYEFLLRHHRDLYVQVLYSLALWFVVIALRDSPVDTFVQAVFVLVPVWVVFRIGRTKARVPSDTSLSPEPGRA
jgi:hypothetical protein